MEKNIFEGAKFGDKFVTRSGHKVFFVCFRDTYVNMPGNYACIVDETIPIVKTIRVHGWINNDLKKENPLDIVSRYQEPIDEEKLDDIYEEYSTFYQNGHCIVESSMQIIEKNAFKAGYRKAKEK